MSPGEARVGPRVGFDAPRSGDLTAFLLADKHLAPHGRLAPGLRSPERDHGRGHVDTRKLLPREVVVNAIVAHLAAHPLATDSASGVTRWWLGPACAGVGVDEVEAALASLVEQGLLRRLTLADGSVLYAGTLPTRQ